MKQRARVFYPMTLQEARKLDKDYYCTWYTSKWFTEMLHDIRVRQTAAQFKAAQLIGE